MPDYLQRTMMQTMLFNTPVFMNAVTTHPPGSVRSAPPLVCPAPGSHMHAHTAPGGTVGWDSVWDSVWVEVAVAGSSGCSTTSHARSYSTWWDSRV
jgi:hypothetical protein